MTSATAHGASEDNVRDGRPREAVGDAQPRSEGAAGIELDGQHAPAGARKRSAYMQGEHALPCSALGAAVIART